MTTICKKDGVRIVVPHTEQTPKEACSNGQWNWFDNIGNPYDGFSSIFFWECFGHSHEEKKVSDKK